MHSYKKYTLTGLPHQRVLRFVFLESQISVAQSVATPEHSGKISLSMTVAVHNQHTGNLF